MTSPAKTASPAVDVEQIRSLWDRDDYPGADRLVSTWLRGELPDKQRHRANFLLAQSYFKQGRASAFRKLVDDGLTMPRPNHQLMLLRQALVAGNIERAKHHLCAIEAETEADDSNRLKANSLLEIAQAELALPRRTADDVLCILGSAYCGSTFLSLLLGSIDGVANVGESYRLTRASQVNKLGYHAQDFDFDRDPLNQLEPCLTCGPDCEKLGYDIRKSLFSDRAHWYERIAAQMAGQTLLATDKSQTAELSPRLPHRYIVLFRSPAAAYKSAFARAPQSLNGVAKRAHAEAFLQSYCRAYSGYLDLDRAGTVFMSWDRFTQAPESTWTQLCAHLDLPDDDAPLSQPRDGQHCFGGNSELNSFLDGNSGRARIRASKPLSPQQRREIGYSDCKPRTWAEHVHRRLMRKHQRFFPTRGRA